MRRKGEGKEKEKVKVDSKEQKEHSLVKSKHRTPSRKSEGDCAWWLRRKTRQEGFCKGGFRNYPPVKGSRSVGWRASRSSTHRRGTSGPGSDRHTRKEKGQKASAQNKAAQKGGFFFVRLAKSPSP